MVSGADFSPSAMAASEPPDPQGPLSGWAKVFQLSTRLPYFLPLILSLVVLFVAATLTNGELDRVKERETALDAREKELRLSNDARVVKLEGLTLDLVKQLRAGKADAASSASETAAKTP
ncbi:hypothetical protein BTHE68_39960 [Burkholderia sp. THE68]|nr:hypothetical protein BTHE68_39960 [Burkholderia sp. THE68]